MAYHLLNLVCKTIVDPGNINAGINAEIVKPCIAVDQAPQDSALVYTPVKNYILLLFLFISFAECVFPRETV